MHILLRPEDSEPAASPGPTGIGRAQRDDQSVWLPVSLRRFLRKQSMIVTTTPSVEGKRITRYCGVVAGEAIKRRVEEQLVEGWGLTPRWVSSSKEAGGVINSYEHPQRLGSDRWAAIIGARQHALRTHPDHVPPVLAVMVGTAVTVDAVDAARVDPHWLRDAPEQVAARFHLHPETDVAAMPFAAARAAEAVVRSGTRCRPAAIRM